MNYEKIQLEYYDDMVKRYNEYDKYMQEIVKLFNETVDDDLLLEGYIIRKRNMVYRKYATYSKRPSGFGKQALKIAHDFNATLRQEINEDLKAFDYKFGLTNQNYL